MLSMLKDIQTVRCSDAVAAGQTAIDGAVVDTDGFEGTQFEILFGTITAGAVTSIKVQEGTKADGSDMADLKGSNITVPDTASNGVFISDVFKASKRYLRVVVTRGTQNAVVDGILAHQYGARTMPVTQDASVIASSLLVSPAEGTP